MPSLRSLLPLALTLLVACDGDPKETGCPWGPWYPDADRDGWGDATRPSSCEPLDGYANAGGDCDDGDLSVNPAMAELCNGIDDDCDGTVDGPDPADAPTWYPDADGDGYGDPAGATAACTAPTGTVDGRRGSDCDDGNAQVHPGATETCDRLDNDCDGTVDDVTGQAATWYPDADGDGWGDDAGAQTGCPWVSGYVEQGGDCDDTDPTRNPGTTEVCDGLDNDCDGVSDEADAADATDWYADADADGFGTDAATRRSCFLLPGFAASAGDCDDDDPAVSPGATETCNGLDDDCDGDVDEDGAAEAPWYADADGDGWGDPTRSVRTCDPPPGWVPDGSDCDDGDATVHPGAAETTPGVDSDCDGDMEVVPVAVAAVDPTSPLTHCAPLTLDGTGSTDADGTVAAWAWTLVTPGAWSSNTTADLHDADDPSPVFFPDSAGTYTFSLVVTDNDGNASAPTLLTVDISVRATNDAPVADAGRGTTILDSVACTVSGYGYDCNDCPDATALLDGSASSDPDGEPLSYTWTVTSGDATLSDLHAATPTVTLGGPTGEVGVLDGEEYVVSLQVTDCWGSTSAADAVILSYYCEGLETP